MTFVYFLIIFAIACPTFFLMGWKAREQFDNRHKLPEDARKVVGEVTELREDENGISIVGRIDDEQMQKMFGDNVRIAPGAFSLGPRPVSIFSELDKVSTGGHPSIFDQMQASPPVKNHHVWCEDNKNHVDHPSHWHVVKAGDIVVAQGECPGWPES